MDFIERQMSTMESSGAFVPLFGCISEKDLRNGQSDSSQVAKDSVTASPCGLSAEDTLFSTASNSTEDSCAASPCGLSGRSIESQVAATSTAVEAPPITLYASQQIMNDLFLNPNNPKPISLVANRIGNFIYLQEAPSPEAPVDPTILSSSVAYDPGAPLYPMPTSAFPEDWNAFSSTPSEPFEAHEGLHMYADSSVEVLDWYSLPDISGNYFGRCVQKHRNHPNALYVPTAQPAKPFLSDSFSYFSHSNSVINAETVQPTCHPSSLVPEMHLSEYYFSDSRRVLTTLNDAVASEPHWLPLFSNSHTIASYFTIFDTKDSAYPQVDEEVPSHNSIVRADAPPRSSGLLPSVSSLSETDLPLLADSPIPSLPINLMGICRFLYQQFEPIQASYSDTATLNGLDPPLLYPLVPLLDSPTAYTPIPTGSKVAVLIICDVSTFFQRSERWNELSCLCKARNVSKVIVLFADQNGELVGVQSICPSDLTDSFSVLGAYAVNTVKDPSLLHRVAKRGGFVNHLPHVSTSYNVESGMMDGSHSMVEGLKGEGALGSDMSAAVQNKDACPIVSVSIMDPRMASPHASVDVTIEGEVERELLNRSCIELFDILAEESNYPPSLGTTLYVYRSSASDRLHFVNMELYEAATHLTTCPTDTLDEDKPPLLLGDEASIPLAPSPAFDALDGVVGCSVLERCPCASKDPSWASESSNELHSMQGGCRCGLEVCFCKGRLSTVGVASPYWFRRRVSLPNEVLLGHTRESIALQTAILCFRVAVALSERFTEPTLFHTVDAAVAMGASGNPPSASSDGTKNPNTRAKKMDVKRRIKAHVWSHEGQSKDKRNRLSLPSQGPPPSDYAKSKRLPYLNDFVLARIEKAIPIDTPIKSLHAGTLTQTSPLASLLTIDNTDYVDPSVIYAKRIQCRRLLIRTIRNLMFVCGSNKQLLMDPFLLDQRVLLQLTALLASAYEYLGDTFLFEMEATVADSSVGQTGAQAYALSPHLLLKAIRSYFMAFFYIFWRQKAHASESATTRPNPVSQELLRLYQRVFDKSIRCFMHLVTYHLAVRTTVSSKGLGYVLGYLLILSSLLNQTPKNHSPLLMASVSRSIADTYGHLAYILNTSGTEALLDAYRREFDCIPFIRLFSTCMEPQSDVGVFLKAFVFTGQPFLPIRSSQISCDLETNLNGGVTFYLKALRLAPSASLSKDAFLRESFVPIVQKRLAKAYDSLRRLYTSTGRFTKAMIHCKQGVELFEALEDRINSAYLQYAMCNLKLQEACPNLTAFEDAPLLAEEELETALNCLATLRTSHVNVKFCFEETHSLNRCNFCSMFRSFEASHEMPSLNLFEGAICMEKQILNPTLSHGCIECACGRLCNTLSIYIGRLHLRVARTFMACVPYLCEETVSFLLAKEGSTNDAPPPAHQHPQLSQFRQYIVPFGCIEAVFRYGHSNALKLIQPSTKDQKCIVKATEHLEKAITLLEAHPPLCALAHFCIGCINLREALLRLLGHYYSTPTTTTHPLKLKHLLRSACSHMQSSIHLFHIQSPPVPLKSAVSDKLKAMHGSTEPPADSALICNRCNCEHSKNRLLPSLKEERFLPWWTWYFISSCIVLRTIFQLIQWHPSLSHEKGMSKDHNLENCLKALSNISDLLPYFQHFVALNSCSLSNLVAAPTIRSTLIEAPGVSSNTTTDYEEPTGTTQCHTEKNTRKHWASKASNSTLSDTYHTVSAVSNPSARSSSSSLTYRLFHTYSNILHYYLKSETASLLLNLVHLEASKLPKESTKPSQIGSGHYSRKGTFKFLYQYYLESGFYKFEWDDMSHLVYNEQLNQILSNSYSFNKLVFPQNPTKYNDECMVMLLAFLGVIRFYLS